MSIISYTIDKCVGKWFCTFLHEDGTKTISDAYNTIHEALKAGDDKLNVGIKWNCKEDIIADGEGFLPKGTNVTKWEDSL